MPSAHSLNRPATACCCSVLRAVQCSRMKDASGVQNPFRTKLSSIKENITCPNTTTVISICMSTIDDAVISLCSCHTSLICCVKLSLRRSQRLCRLDPRSSKAVIASTATTLLNWPIKAAAYTYKFDRHYCHHDTFIT